MWKNHLVVAARTLAKNRLFTALNVGGLAVGMAACVLISLWVQTETTYDRWLPEAARVFEVQARTQYPGKPRELWAGSPLVMLPVLAQDFPQITAFTRLLRGERAVRRGARLENQSVVLADKGFFQVLQLPLLEGSAEGPLQAPDRVAVSERFARSWFGDERAVGQTLTVTVKGEPRPFTVAAVLRELPPNSSFEVDLLMLLAEADLPDPELAKDWGNFSCTSLVKLSQPSDAAQLEAAADAFIDRHAKDFLRVEGGFYYRPTLTNVTALHLQSVQVSSGFRPPGDPRLIAGLAATGLLILIIAVITFVNLATTRVSVRAREVGLRKTLGAERGQLMAQFLVESTLVATLAAAVALALVELTLPAFNALLGQRLQLTYLGLRGALLPLTVMALAVGLAGGWYPALVLTRLRPREALSGQQGPRGGARLRQALVVGQFGIAVLLMTAMAIVYAQVAHLRRADMGYQPEGLVVVSGLQRAEVRAVGQQLLEAFKRVPGVVAATRSVFDPTSRGLARQSAFLPGVPDAQAPQVSGHPIDWDYLRTYGAQLLAGRDLSEAHGEDDWPDLPEEELIQRGGNALINREALKFFGTTDPHAALGKSFKLGSSVAGKGVPVTVVGVIENLRLRSAREPVLPSFYARDVGKVTTVSVRFAGVAPAELMGRLEAAWRQLLPNTPFAAKAVDQAIASYYADEARRGDLFAAFAGVAIVLCAVGLYGLAVFTAQRRTREIGIRKVLGATTSDLVRLLLWDFSKPVLLATALAWPLAWWLMRGWLDGFDVRIALGPLPFLASGLLALAIAWATVTWHAVRVARTLPMQALRQE